MQTLILTVLALAAMALCLSFRRSVVTAAPLRIAPRPNRIAAPSRIPTVSRCVHPRQANRPDVQVWVLRASNACTLTREMLDGRRYPTETAPALPGVGCRQQDCQCHYQPLTEARRRERRRGEDRRDQFRFEKRSDRRRHDDRRQNDQWRHAALR
jgi:hypothetical protein